MNTHDIEQQRAAREGECNRSAEDYFSARPQQHSLATEDAFRQGFYRGHDAAAIALDRQGRGEPAGCVLMEGGKAVASFDEIPVDGHWDASAYTPVGMIGKPAEPVKVPSDAEIIELAKKHIHPGFDQLNAIRPVKTPYENTEGFKRVKAYTAEILSRFGQPAQPAPIPDGILAFDGGTLRIEKDGRGSIVVTGDQFTLEDDRGEGPDGPQGSVHWVARIQASEVLALRNFLYTQPARPTDDELWDKTLEDRDHYHDMADKLAEAIAEYFGADIGEHSNMNCPWTEALEVIGNAAAARAQQGGQS